MAPLAPHGPAKAQTAPQHRLLRGSDTRCGKIVEAGTAAEIRLAVRWRFMQALMAKTLLGMG